MWPGHRKDSAMEGFLLLFFLAIPMIFLGIIGLAVLYGLIQESFVKTAQ
jgi:hypothetical protein